MKLPKLIAGKMNIPYIRVKPGYATGARRPRRETDKIRPEFTNKPVLCIVLRKVA